MPSIFESDFQVTSQDSNTRRRRVTERSTQDLKALHLKKLAVPHIFYGLTKCLSKTVPLARSSNSTSSSMKMNLLHDLKSARVFLSRGELDSFRSLKVKLNEIILPTTLLICFCDAEPSSICLILYQMQ